MKTIQIPSLNSEQQRQIRHMWNHEYPERLRHDTDTSFAEYLQPLENQRHILLLDERNEVKGWLFVFERSGQDWFAMILDHALQGKGHGSQLLHLVKNQLSQLNGWVIDHSLDRKGNGKPYSSPLQFYVKNGFTVHPERRLETAQLSAVHISWRK